MNEQYTKEISAYMAQQATINAMTAKQRRAYERDLTRRAWKLHAEVQRERLKNAPKGESELGLIAQMGILIVVVWLLSQAGITPFGE